MAIVRRMLVPLLICLLASVVQCRASASSRRRGPGGCDCSPSDLVAIGRVLHRHHLNHQSLWQWYEAGRQGPRRQGPRRHRHTGPSPPLPQNLQSFEWDEPASFLQEQQLPGARTGEGDDVATQGPEECPCAAELYWAINTQKTVLSIISSLELEKADLQHTETALAAKAMAELHLQASHLKVGVTEGREEEAEDDIALEAADLEQAQEATLATQDSTSGGNIDNLQQDTAVVEQTDQLADIQSQQLDADVLEKKVALEKINHIVQQASVHVADMEVKSKIQSADIHEDRVPTELEINQAIRMLEDARPRVQTEEAQLVVEQCMHELQQALDVSAQVRRLEQRIKVQINQNPELQLDPDETAPVAFTSTPTGAGAYPDAAPPAGVPPEPSVSALAPETPEIINYSAIDGHATQARTVLHRTPASRRERELGMRHQIRGAARKLVQLEASLESLEGAGG